MTEAKTTGSAENSKSTNGNPPSTAVIPPAGAPGTTPRGLTVEQGLYALLFLIALGMRLYRLDSLNLVSPWEASQVWPAWLGPAASGLAGNQLPAPVPPVSPLLFTLQRALFLLTGGGNVFWARFAPACAGAGMVLAAWALRRRMGRAAALTAAVLFAIDPWLLSFSRMADSALLSMLTGLLLLIWLVDGSEDGRTAPRLAVVGGLFLISGPLAWLLLPPILFLVVRILVVRFLVARTGSGPIGRLEGRQSGRAALLFVGAVVVGSTGLFAHLSGLAAISESLGAAIGHLIGPLYSGAPPQATLDYPLDWALLRLLVDEPFPLLFGGVGLVIALLKIRGLPGGSLALLGEESGEDETRHRGAQDTLWLQTLAGSVGWGLLLILLPARAPVSLLVLILPLLLLAAALTSALLRSGLTSGLRKGEAYLPTLIPMLVLLVTAFFWTGKASISIRDGNYEPLMLVLYLLIPALGAFFCWWSGARVSGQAFGLLVLVAFFLAQISSSWMLNLRPETNSRRSLFAEVGDRGLALLVEDVARLSSLRTGDSTTAPVYLQVEPTYLPYFAWHLRAMRNLHWRPGLELTDVEDDALIVAQVGAGQEEKATNLPAGFIGSSYAATQRWLPTDLVGPAPYMRWMMYRERPKYPESGADRQEVELWVKRE